MPYGQFNVLSPHNDSYNDYIKLWHVLTELVQVQHQVTPPESFKVNEALQD